MLRKENGHSVDDTETKKNGNGNGNGNGGNGNGGTVSEEGLRDWFGKSKSKDGKKGWVQVVSGKPCARQPGQKSTPKCVSSAKRASMSKSERESPLKEEKELLIQVNHKRQEQQNQLTFQLINLRRKCKRSNRVCNFTTWKLKFQITIRDFNLGLMFRESLDT